MNREEFIKKIEVMGFVKHKPLIANNDIYIKKMGIYQVKIDVWSECIKCWLLFDTTTIATFELLLFNDETISLLNNLLIGFDTESHYTITFDVEDMIKEAEFCGYKINEKQAKNLIDYLNNKSDGVYETIQQYITGYCQNNKFEEIKEDEE